MVQVAQGLWEASQLVVGYIQLCEVGQPAAEGGWEAGQTVVGQVQDAKVAQLVDGRRNLRQLVATENIKYNILKI